MQINLDGNIINVEIIRKPNKNIYMRFINKDTLQVSCNKWVNEKSIKNLLDNNWASLKKMYQKISIVEEKNQYFWYLGQKYNPIYLETIKKVVFDGPNIYAKDEKMLNNFLKKETERIFKGEVERILPYFDNIPRFSLKIRNMKTRWGVNNQGNMTITLNSELIKKDLDLLDYVIIHELCHYYEPNHSSRFWSHVEKYYPKYKEARKRLKN